jgi:acetyl-CoA carboxylase carboxyl transferase subunit beta
MSWLNKVRNSLSSLTAKKDDTPDNLWIKCQELRGDAVHQGLRGQSLRLPALRPSRPHRHRRAPRASARPGFTVLPTPAVKDDPLKFRDTKKYPTA